MSGVVCGLQETRAEWIVACSQSVCQHDRIGQVPGPCVSTALVLPSSARYLPRDALRHARCCAVSASAARVNKWHNVVPAFRSRSTASRHVDLDVSEESSSLDLGDSRPVPVANRRFLNSSQCFPPGAIPLNPGSSERRRGDTSCANVT